jgi:hypothetical protein
MGYLNMAPTMNLHTLSNNKYLQIYEKVQNWHMCFDYFKQRMYPSDGFTLESLTPLTTGKPRYAVCLRRTAKR